MISPTSSRASSSVGDSNSLRAASPDQAGPASTLALRERTSSSSVPGDATANPYLALVAVGAAVYLGIADKIEPGDKLEGYGYDPDRAQILPMGLGDALDALEANSELADVLGSYFVSSFLAYKRNEVERFERFVTDWEFREYAYHL
jgi:glutamine synthetase